MTTDQYQWLEEIESERSVNWIQEENSRTLNHFQGSKYFQSIYDSSLEILNRKDKIPFINIQGDLVFNHWQDENNPFGLLRASSIDDFKSRKNNWNVLIDLDQLAKKDCINWVFHGISRYENTNKALIYLSREGLDAHVIKEFDLEKKEFIEEGFEFPEAKGSANWIDANTLYISIAHNEEEKNDSGYARRVKIISRGQKIDQAKTIYETSKNEMGPRYFKIRNKKKDYYFVQHNINFFESKIFLHQNNEFVPIELPRKNEYQGSVHSTLFYKLGEDWKSFKQNDLIAIDIEKSLLIDDYQLVFRPNKEQSIKETSSSKDYLSISLMDNISSSLYRVHLSQNEWKMQKVNLPEHGTVYALTSDESSNDLFCAYSSFNCPTIYYHINLDTLEKTCVNKLSSKYNFLNYSLSQNFVKSKDGTSIPYYVLHKNDISYNGTNPTIIYGYGGFEIPICPSFNETVAPCWLEGGGILVYANIRGGGEFGPAWHQAALKNKRHKAYEDFFSIAEDLIDRKITSSKHLGARGGSNGGLLMGVCYTQRPDLFKAINCLVPLLDMLRYHKLLAGASWIPEYGDPEIQKEREYLESYSPYQNLHCEKIKNTSILLYTSTRDDRVHPAHARKMAAKVKESKLPYYYFENREGGHSGNSNFKDLARQLAIEYSFLWEQLS